MIRFYFDGCDADLSLGEFLMATFCGLAVVFGPLVLKVILRAIL